MLYTESMYLSVDGVQGKDCTVWMWVYLNISYAQVFSLRVLHQTTRLNAMAVPQSTASSADDLSKLPPRSHSLSYFLQIGLAFATVFFPLFLIATLLCLFVTLPIWTLPNTFEENPNLPIRPVDSSFFLTLVLSNKVSLTSSFASNIAQFAAAPFLLLFSFLVALELAKGQEDVDQDTTRLVTWDPKFLLSWAVLRVWRKGNGRRARGTRVAGIGALISIVLTYVLSLICR
jgi:hypothetical protein